MSIHKNDIDDGAKKVIRFTSDFGSTLFLLTLSILNRSLKKFNSQGMRVYDIPQLSKIDLIAAYKAADVFALITHGEGWGRPLMDAMASG